MAPSRLRFGNYSGSAKAAAPLGWNKSPVPPGNEEVEVLSTCHRLGFILRANNAPAAANIVFDFLLHSKVAQANETGYNPFRAVLAGNN
jgi:hypothetical protein